MALFPFILVATPALKNHEHLMRHERIHLRQQVELLIIPFYILYLSQYFWFRTVKKYSHKKAYHALCFEREAYANDWKNGYFRRRIPFSFLKYLFR